MIDMTEAEFERKLEKAAKAGARIALREVGLDDDLAGSDIRDLRELLKAWKDTKSAVWQSVIRYFTTFMLGALTLGLIWKVKG